MSKSHLQLEKLADFALAVRRNGATWSVPAASEGLIGTPFVESSLYCPRCGDERRMQITALHWRFKTGNLGNFQFPGGSPKNRDLLEGQELESTLVFLTPSMFRLTCVQCTALFTAVIHTGPDGPNLTILPSCRGGLTTPNTPGSVAYYLDQAERSYWAGALSAAVAMFRGALEQLLFEQKYKKGACGVKLQALRDDISQSKAPKWAMDLDTDFLQVLKELGDGSIHPNDGDITRQAAVDRELLSSVRETFQWLLYLVYEVPHEKKTRLQALRAKAQALKK